ncbi:MAG: antitoxin Xre/MbcA/ParS toxin-binding domain-containing protein [Cyclobacteriaceae bacterium]
MDFASCIKEAAISLVRPAPASGRAGDDQNIAIGTKRSHRTQWQQLADILHISVRTLQRYQPDQVLSTPLSERLLRLADVYAKGFGVFEDRTMFQRWMQEPIPALGYTVPLSLLPSLYGMDAIMEELGRIEHDILA